MLPVETDPLRMVFKMCKVLEGLRSLSPAQGCRASEQTQLLGCTALKPVHLRVWFCYSSAGEGICLSQKEPRLDGSRQEMLN